LRDSHNAAAAIFLSFLQSPKAATVFQGFGYQPLAGTH
jgi:hypothetical protein